MMVCHNVGESSPRLGHYFSLSIIIGIISAEWIIRNCPGGWQNIPMFVLLATHCRRSSSCWCSSGTSCRKTRNWRPDMAWHGATIPSHTEAAMKAGHGTWGHIPFQSSTVNSSSWSREASRWLLDVCHFTSFLMFKPHIGTSLRDSYLALAKTGLSKGESA